MGELDPARTSTRSGSRSTGRRRPPPTRVGAICDDRPLRTARGAGARRAGAGHDAARLDRRRRRRRRRPCRVLENELAAPPGGHVRRRHVHRLPGPPPDDAAARRREHRADLARDRAARRAATPPATTCCCSAATSPTPTGACSPTRVIEPRPRARRAHDGRPRRLPVRHAAQPPVAPVDDRRHRRGGGVTPVSSATPSTSRPASRPRSSGASATSACPPSGLWAQVPHYVVERALPGGQLALLDGAAARSAGVVDRRAWRSRNEASQPSRPASTSSSPASTEHVAMVRQLEEAYDSSRAARRRPTSRSGPLPTGDELAAELERFLREQGS